MKLVRFLVATTLATTTMVFTLAKTALADRYQAGNFTVTIADGGANGQTYHGCDAKGNCLFLEYGTGWRDEGWRGITWSNGDYYYSISWEEGSLDRCIFESLILKEKELSMR
jgi:hypothetical protein